MSDGDYVSRIQQVPRSLRSVVFGTEDPRLRATWRFILAFPLILLTGIVVQWVLPVLGVSGMMPAGLIQAGTFLVLLLAWARYVDRRRLADYGFSASGSWALDLFVAFGAVVAAHGIWYAIGTTLGWTSVTVAASAPQGSFALALGTVLVAIGVNVWVQDTVYSGVVLQGAAEGLRSRDLEPRHAVLGGWLAGIAFVVLVHDRGIARSLGLFAAGGFFGLLYVHTGELALPIGFHTGVNLSGGTLFAPAARVGESAVGFAVSESLPALGFLSAPRIPQMLIAFLLLVGWLYWRRGEVGIDSGIARWSGR